LVGAKSIFLQKVVLAGFVSYFFQPLENFSKLDSFLHTEGGRATRHAYTKNTKAVLETFICGQDYAHSS
jgi:hypothetical protein